MQLTQEDVMENEFGREGMDLSKLQQVIEFYSNIVFHRRDLQTREDCDEYVKLFDIWSKQISTKETKLDFDDWLFNYCFVKGLKQPKSKRER